MKNTEIDFNDGLNVLIGHNNAGKTNLLKALQLVIEPHYRYRRLNTYDFCREISLNDLKAHSPSITISLTIKNSDLSYNEQEEDLRVVANWLTELENGYEAMLSYRFFLPAEKEEEYLSALADVNDLNACWGIIENDFLRYYVYKLLAGPLESPVTPEIDKYSSVYSQIFEVRECARRIQREFAKEHDCIFEGRAMGSVDFPDAFLKIYLDATPEERARRRVKQNEEKGIESSYETILKEIKERDYRDSHRDIEVLKVPDGGIVVDSTNMTIDEVVERIVELAKERM